MSITKWISSLFQKLEPESVDAKDAGLDARQESVKTEVASTLEDAVAGLSPEQRMFWDYASRITQVLNESLNISNSSKNPETKVSRLELAKLKLNELVELINVHPYIKLTNIDDVRKTIENLTEKYVSVGYFAATEGADQGYQQDVWKQWNVPMMDMTKGFRFTATLQLRTPLRVISRHMEYHEGLTDPPRIAHTQWEGCWLPVLKTWAEQGIEGLPEIPDNGYVASSVGPLENHGVDFQKFLVALRTIVESNQSIEARRDAIEGGFISGQWRDFCILLGGHEDIKNRFFPMFIHTINGIPSSVLLDLQNRGLTTPKKLAQESDESLLSIKGIGPAKLKAIRLAAESATNQNAEFLDLVRH